MSYRWVQHTGELELDIEAVTEEGVFAHAHLVKEVTYHRLAFEPTRDGLRATGVLDA